MSSVQRRRNEILNRELLWPWSKPGRDPCLGSATNTSGLPGGLGFLTPEFVKAGIRGQSMRDRWA